jgi:hypothetical protein
VKDDEVRKTGKLPLTVRDLYLVIESMFGSQDLRC